MVLHNFPEARIDLPARACFQVSLEGKLVKLKPENVEAAHVRAR